jgi:ribosomal protein S12 methylthiotransferase accessory factor YcaO
MTVDIPNAFLQTDVKPKNGERIIMKIKGALVDMLVAMNPELYQDYVVMERNTEVIYVEVLKALYGMLEPYCSTRNSRMIWKALDSLSIHITHVLQIEWSMVNSTQ